MTQKLGGGRHTAPFSLETETSRLADLSGCGAVAVIIDPAGGISVQFASVSGDDIISAGAAALIGALTVVQEGAATCPGCADKTRRLTAALDALGVSQGARLATPVCRVTH